MSESLDLLRHSVFRSARDVKPFASATVSHLAADFRSSERLRSMIAELRRLPYGSDEYAEAKRHLPAFTPAGSFTERRADGLDHHFGRVVIDLDDLGSLAEAQGLRDRIAARADTCMAFVSPSGLGVKVVLEVDPVPANAAEHTAAWNTASDILKRAFGVQVDESGKDVARLCFVSSDPGAYSNWWCQQVRWELPRSTALRDARRQRRNAHRRSDELNLESVAGVVELRALAGDAEADHVRPMGRAISALVRNGQWGDAIADQLIQIGNEVHYAPNEHDWAQLVPRFAAQTQV